LLSDKKTLGFLYRHRRVRLNTTINPLIRSKRLFALPIPLSLYLTGLISNSRLSLSVFTFREIQLIFRNVDKLKGLMKTFLQCFYLTEFSCSGFRLSLGKKMIDFQSLLTTFEAISIFGGMFIEAENCLEPSNQIII
jgi:hypothetical protein